MDETAVLEANDAFYRALNQKSQEAMDRIWARSAPVACIHPGWNMLVGREAVSELGERCGRACLPRRGRPTELAAAQRDRGPGRRTRSSQAGLSSHGGIGGARKWSPGGYSSAIRAREARWAARTT